MERKLKHVAYSCEHGDETLPYLKDLVSDTPDPEKSKILAYLKKNCILACPGLVYDEITPGKVIGTGSNYSDGVYCWTDQFTNYVDQYNIPVPNEFREHILKNFSFRMRRHTYLRLIDKVMIENYPCSDYQYIVIINKNGAIEYQNSVDHPTKTSLQSKPEDFRFFIDPMMKELFCYDTDNYGKEIVGGYHWKLSFYRKDELIDEVAGWPGEDEWRYRTIKRIIKRLEHTILKSVGSEYMKVF